MSSNGTVSIPPDLHSVPSLNSTFGALLIATFIGLMYVTAYDGYKLYRAERIPTAAMG